MYAGDSLPWQANAFLMEHQILDHVKEALRVALDWKVPAVGMPRKISSVQFTMKSFERHFQRVMQLEEANGYLQVVSERVPNWDEKVKRLEADHRAFRCALEELGPRIEALNDHDSESLEEVCAFIGSLLDQVDHHDEEEIKLLQESMLSDIGGEG